MDAEVRERGGQDDSKVDLGGMDKAISVLVNLFEYLSSIIS